jgi:hypothetical protein
VFTPASTIEERIMIVVLMTIDCDGNLFNTKFQKWCTPQSRNTDSHPMIMMIIPGSRSAGQQAAGNGYRQRAAGKQAIYRRQSRGSRQAVLSRQAGNLQAVRQDTSIDRRQQTVGSKQAAGRKQQAEKQQRRRLQDITFLML